MKKFVVLTGLILISLPSSKYAAERLSLGYIYSSPLSHSEIIANTNDSINVVSPTCFDLTSKGRLEINNLLNREFIDEMHEKGIKVTPFLSNHWGKQRAHAALDNPEVLVNELVTAINEYNLDGVNVDIENISTTYKDKLTNFVKILREALPEEKTVSVAVAANPERLEKTWVASYDYAGLAEYSDYLVLMAYDEHCQGGAAGPVASIEFVRKSLEYILESVSKDKVVLGMPLYGRFWKEGAETGGEAIVIGAVENLIKKYHLVPTLDTKTMTPKLTVNIDGIKTNAYVNGRYLEEGTYNIWYENESSIKAKLQLVNEHNLLGTALWALDNESKEFWTYYKDALNETQYENEKEIRIRQRVEAYARIVDLKPIEIELKIVYPKGKITLNDKALEKVEEIKAYEYDVIECVIKENKVKLVKSEKRKIKSVAHTEKHELYA